LWIYHLVEFIEIRICYVSTTFSRSFNITGYFLMSEIKRSDIKTGMQVKIVMKEDQRTGDLTEGIVKDILTSLPAGRQNLPSTRTE
jgi:uncharacterized repeat protein (TIGR03833 family)